VNRCDEACVVFGPLKVLVVFRARKREREEAWLLVHLRSAIAMCAGGLAAVHNDPVLPSVHYPPKKRSPPSADWTASRQCLRSLTPSEHMEPFSFRPSQNFSKVWLFAARPYVPDYGFAAKKCDLTERYQTLTNAYPIPTPFLVT